jgi:hypothetical protein
MQLDRRNYLYPDDFYGPRDHQTVLGSGSLMVSPMDGVQAAYHEAKVINLLFDLTKVKKLPRELGRGDKAEATAFSNKMREISGRGEKAKDLDDIDEKVSFCSTSL